VKRVRKSIVNRYQTGSGFKRLFSPTSRGDGCCLRPKPQAASIFLNRFRLFLLVQLGCFFETFWVLYTPATATAVVSSYRTHFQFHTSFSTPPPPLPFPLLQRAKEKLSPRRTNNNSCNLRRARLPLVPRSRIPIPQSWFFLLLLRSELKNKAATAQSTLSSSLDSFCRCVLVRALSSFSYDRRHWGLSCTCTAANRFVAAGFH
jgi:hypothetical protein